MAKSFSGPKAENSPSCHPTSAIGPPSCSGPNTRAPLRPTFTLWLPAFLRPHQGHHPLPRPCRPTPFWPKRTAQPGRLENCQALTQLVRKVFSEKHCILIRLRVSWNQHRFWWNYARQSARTGSRIQEKRNAAGANDKDPQLIQGMLLRKELACPI